MRDTTQPAVVGAKTGRHYPMAIHGRNAANLLVDLKCTVDEETLHLKKVRILDHKGHVVASIKTSQVRDKDPKMKTTRAFAA